MKENLIRGKIAAERTGIGIPDLLVVVADRDPSQLDESEATDPSVGDSWRLEGIWADLTKSGDRIGSVLTDEQGRFELEYDDSEYRGGDQEYRPDLWFIVLAPETTQEFEETPTEPSGELEEESAEILTRAFAVPPEEQIIHVSNVSRVEAGRTESYILYLTDEQIEQAGVVLGSGAFEEPEEFDPVEAADEYLTTVANDLDFRANVKAGLVEIQERQERVDVQREYYEDIRAQTQVLTATPMSLAQSVHFVPEFAEPSVFREKKTEVRAQGLGHIENYREEIEDSNPWALVLTDDVFVHLGIAIPEQAPTTVTLTDEAFCSLMRRPSEGYDLTRVRGLLEQEFSEEGDGVGGSGEPTETEEGEQQEEIDVEAEIRRRVLDKVSDGTIADGAESEDGDRETQRRNTLSQIAANDGPADITSIHDFHSLQIAFRHVWTEAFDPSVKRLIEDVYEAHVRLQEETGVEDALDVELREISNIDDFIRDVERSSEILSEDVPPYVSAIWADATTEVWNLLSPAEQQRLSELALEIDARSVRIGPFARISDSRNEKASVADRRAAGQRIIAKANSRQASGVRTRLTRLLAELRDRLSTPYAFHYFHPGDEETGPAVNYGLLTTYRQEWTPIQYQVGDLVSTIPLAPGETRKYEKKEEIKRSRATKEIENALSSRRGESTQTRRAEAEIVDKASLNSNFKMSASGGFGSFFQASSEFSLNQARESARTKKDFREAVLKASHEYKQERSLEISTTDELTAETTSSGELSNPNNELSVTYLLYELERLYRISERIHQLTPVVLVPQDIPAPHEITESWLLEHEWILRRVLLDDSLQFALDYLTESFAGDELSLEIKEAHWEMRRNLLTELEATVEERRTVRDSLRDLHDLLSVGFRGRDMAEVIDIVEDNSEALSDLGGEFAEMSDLLRERAMDLDAIPRKRLRRDIERLLERREAMVEEAQQQLSSAAEALDAAMNGYATALEERTNQRVAIDTLRVHVRQNILYYMQAIWEHEPPDQRYLRLYHREVYVPRVGNVNVTIRRVEDIEDVSDPFGLQRFMSYDGERYVIETESLPVGAMESEEGNTAQLVEVADLDNPLGYWGNCVIFPLQTCTFITDYMMHEYVDQFLGIRDPDPLSEFTSEQIREFVERKRTEIETEIDEDEDLSEEEKQEMKEVELSNLEEALGEVIQQRLSNPRRETDLVVVPTGQLYMEALKGDEALLEEFKLTHRKYDMEKARAELRQEELENLRYAARLLEAEPDLDDPDADRYVVVEGVDSGVVVSVDESDGNGSDGESG